jgi:hypothetical protein
MVPVYSPQTESEAAVISSLLEAHQIPFFLRGGAFSKLYPGMQINHYNTQTFMVPDESFEFARELLAEFISPSEEIMPVSKTSIWQKLRILIEAIFCGWFVTGRRWHNDEK